MGLPKYTATELRKKNKAELEELAEAEGLELDEDALVGDYREALLGVEVDEDEVDDDDEIEDEASDEADEVDDEADDEADDEDELPEVDEADELDDEPKKPVTKKSKKTKYTEGGKNADGEKLLGAKEVAAHVGTDAKTLRQFFRSGKSTTFQAVGAGGRYEFSEAQLPAIKSEFESWKASKPGRGRGAANGESKPRKSRGKAAPKPEETLDEIEEVEDLDDLDDIEID